MGVGAFCFILEGQPMCVVHCATQLPLFLHLDTANVHTWSYKREMFLLSNCKPCTTSTQSSRPRALWELPDNTHMNNGRLPIPVHRPNGTTNYGTVPSTSTSMPQSQTQTVVIENPMTVDSNGKLVSNVVVGVTTDKK
ncbi:hypothetical protein DS421_13g433440 [Arachis hypogaea]|nr:hypothetical protein DS421_13g433440 [Arachis hypogaea]